MKYKGKIILDYKIEYPEFFGKYCGESVIKMNECQKKKALDYQDYCENYLYSIALENFRYSVFNDFPIRAFEAMVTYEITYNKNCILSLYYDIYEYTGGAHGITLRCADTCDLKNGRSVELRHLFFCHPNYKSYLLNQISKQIEQNQSFYFEDYKTLIETNFNEDSFYLRPRGVVIFYQQYAVAPYASGIREFFIPYYLCAKSLYYY